MRLRLDHFAVPIFDAAASHHFYAEVLGLTLLDALSGDDWGGKPWLMMIFGVGDGRAIALCARRGAARPPRGEEPDDIVHYALAVEGVRELDAWRGRLREHGVAFREEDHGAQRSIYFEDPNGLTLEITAPPSEAAMQQNAQAVGVVKRWMEE